MFAYSHLSAIQILLITEGRDTVVQVLINFDIIKANMIFLSLGLTIFAGKERWNFGERTAHKMVKSQNYDQVPLKIFSFSWQIQHPKMGSSFSWRNQLLILLLPGWWWDSFEKLHYDFFLILFYFSLPPFLTLGLLLFICPNSQVYEEMNKQVLDAILVMVFPVFHFYIFSL